MMDFVYLWAVSARHATAVSVHPSSRSAISEAKNKKISFLDGCTGLTTVDLSPLSNVTSIGASFLDGCTGLTSVDLSPLSNVTAVNYGLMTNCSDLRMILLPRRCPSILRNAVNFSKDLFAAGAVVKVGRKL